MQTKLVNTLLLFLIALNANAGGGAGGSGIVFDPANYIQTTVSAEQSIYAETQRATQIYNQTQQYRQMLLQNQTTNPAVLTSLLNQNSQDMRSTQTYVGGLTRLLANTGEQRALAQNRLVEVKSSGLSFDEYSKREAERIAAGDQQSKEIAAHERAVLQNVNNDAKFVQDMQTKIPTSAGVHDSSRDMNTMLNKIVAQNSTLIQLQASNSLAQKDKADGEELSKATKASVMQNGNDQIRAYGETQKIKPKLSTNPATQAGQSQQSLQNVLNP